eukprot:CAMPEP_0194265084 /NCGR_PEP_ID=MMETSP0169-20130528/431_1 /TAXON_ID=218684 /ORGANISM="Corethron pennatum, Strain L29A3" /LENGTH=176 /DNA_ID=CAMNT_0039005477 /DNA_START=128 /DNA_END=658 /DNA_ORIENTATION=-
MGRTQQTARKQKEGAGKGRNRPGGQGKENNLDGNESRGRKGAVKGKSAISKKGGDSRPRRSGGGSGGSDTQARRSSGDGGRNASRSRSRNRGARTRGGGGSSKKEKKEKPPTADELDSAMDDYWAKSSNKEIASKKLDEDMDAYWQNKGEQGGGGKEEADTETADVAADAVAAPAE